MAATVTVAGLRPGDRVDGHVVIGNRAHHGSDGQLIHHVLSLRDGDGETRTTTLLASRRVVRESRSSV